MAGGSSANPAAQLTDDILVDILSRVPYRSLCRFRCVSTRWRALIADPAHSSRLPQTLAGFFHSAPIAGGGFLGSAPLRYCFNNVPGTGLPLVDTSFPFLPHRAREHLKLVDSCNGLLLCLSFRDNEDEDEDEPEEFDYLVVNPATEEWVAVPVSWRWTSKVRTVGLGFDPASSSHFYIIEFQLDVNAEDYRLGGCHVLGVKIYSSETRVWCHKQCAWDFVCTTVWI